MSIENLRKIWEATTEQSPYVRYHEIGNRPEKDLGDTKHDNEVLDLLRVGAISPSQARYHLGLPEPEKPMLSMNIPSSSFDYINRVVMNSMAKTFAMTPAELGVVEKPKTTPRAHLYSINRSLRDDIAKICGCAECQQYLKSKETNDMSPFTFSIDLGNISSQSSSPTPEQRLLSVVSDLAKDNPDLARKFKNAAERAEREHKEGIEKALKGVNYLAMKEGHSGRDFCVSFWRGGEAHSLDGTDYAYGQRISEDDVEDESRVFVSGSIFPASGAYYTMDNLKNRMEGSDILYVIEYYPDQD